MRIQNRLLSIKLPPGKSAFLWGPRKVGKSTWIREHMKASIVIDFLKTDVFADYASRPSLLRERYSEAKQLIVIDEVQKVPDILDEVQWLIDNHQISFMLTGSSARKLRKSHANLLGGRAWRYTMTPLCFPEIENLDIEKIMLTGLLPPHLLSTDPIQDLRAYVADYLKEEIAAEAVVQNIPSFSEFLHIASVTSGEILNYTNVSRETGVSAKIIRNYFQILEDTLLGHRLQPWKKSTNRRMVESEKFYLFDVGLANYLARQQPKIGSPAFGKSFEHYIFMELKAYQAYRNPELPLSYWRTSGGAEVDFILGDMECAIEVKTSTRIDHHAAKSLKTLQEDHRLKRSIIVSFENEPKKLNNQIECLPWKLFLEKLWGGDII
ncbi:MAG TPA: ATP-binding protein [Gammaproteobacteria bacterium]|nr:ATP-binding protein [Gammaproteobacteria bacterium]